MDLSQRKLVKEEWEMLEVPVSNEEKEILNDQESFFNSIMSKSFFDKKKLIIILRTNDKILNIIKTIQYYNNTVNYDYSL